MYGVNNYGYNLYGRYIPPQPLQQPLQNVDQSVNNVYKLNGKQVESIDVVKAMDIPLDGSINYFPIIDGSAIVTKQLQMDGTSKTLIYKPVDDKPIKEVKYITSETLTNELKFIQDDIDEIKEELKEFKKKGD